MANDHTLTYIEQYKTIVLNEMERVGVPASIKMAQAILESGNGRSTLARQSNNHFGIKCGSTWNGETVYRHDDDYKNGLLVRSCFRAYDDPADSFIAHSDFLVGNKRYAFLFELPQTDYRSWARGLRKAGYATDPNYANKLINLIEKYELYHLDMGLPVGKQDQLLAHTETKDPANDGPIIIKPKKTEKSPQVIARAKPTYASMRYPLKKGRYTFQVGDNMNDIAAHFKMEVKELYFKNRLAYGARPRVGEQLAIRDYIHFSKKPRAIAPELMPDEEEYLFEETITLSSH